MAVNPDPSGSPDTRRSSSGFSSRPVYRTRVRFHQADPAGVLFFGRVFELVSDAYEDLIRSAFIPFDEPFPKRDFLVPIVHAEADYSRPVHVGEEVLVELSVERIGRSSLKYGFVLRDQDGVERVRGLIVHAFVDAASFAPIEIPERVRGLLEELAAG